MNRSVVLAGTMLIAAGSAAAQVASDTNGVVPLRWAGEFGLAARSNDSVVEVRWMTDGTAPGFLHVVADGELWWQTLTPADSAHRGMFPIPGGARFEVRYGEVRAVDGRYETVLDFGAHPRPRTSWPAPDSVFVISDVHGEFDRMLAVLQNGGVIDEGLRWSGGRQHLVILGDVFDRGPDAIRIMWYLYDLEKQAERTEGRVHVVLGNHEIMVMGGDLRYLSPKDTAVARLHDTEFDALFDPRQSMLGRWLVSKPALIRLGDVLFTHGGVTTDFLGWDLEQVQDTLEAYAAESLFTRWRDTTYIQALDYERYLSQWEFFWDSRSLFWHRGYVRSDSLGPALDSVLQHFDASVLVVGHTPGATVRERYDGKLIGVNTVPFGAEMLLLVRGREGWERWRIGESASAQPVPRELPPPPPPTPPDTTHSRGRRGS